MLDAVLTFYGGVRRDHRVTPCSRVHFKASQLTAPGLSSSNIFWQATASELLKFNKVLLLSTDQDRQGKTIGIRCGCQSCPRAAKYIADRHWDVYAAISCLGSVMLMF